MADRSADRVDKVGMIDTLRDQANTFRREAPQKCAAAFIDCRDIEHEIYGFAIPDRLVAAGLNQLDACRGNLAGDYEPCSFFADFRLYSNHKHVSAPRFPFFIRCNFWGCVTPVPKRSAIDMA
jgi:hypothetical protein